jgi:glycosyltransferase involved in cell wall biosynthesis
VRVTILNIYYGSESIGTGLVASDLAAALAEAGHHVQVVSTSADYGRLRPETVSSGCDSADPDRVRVRRIPVPFRWTGSLVRRLGTYVAFLGAAAPAAWLGGRTDVVLAMVPPSMAGMPAVLLSRIRNARLHLDVEDLYGASDLGNSIAARLNAQLERWLLKRAHCIRVLTPEMKLHVERVAAPAGGVHVVPVWTDTDSIHERGDGAEFRRAHGLDGVFVALHCGNIGSLGGQNVILECARHLLAEPVRFVFVGGGYGVDALRRRVLRDRLSNVVFLDRVPRAVLPNLFAAGDVGLVTLDPRIRGSSTPSKTFAYMAAALPVVAALDPDNAAARAVRAGSAGWVVAPGSADSMMDAIAEARSMAPNDLRRLGLAGRRHVLQSHKRSRCLEKFVQLMERS